MPILLGGGGAVVLIILIVVFMVNVLGDDDDSSTASSTPSDTYSSFSPTFTPASTPTLSGVSGLPSGGTSGLPSGLPSGGTSGLPSSSNLPSSTSSDGTGGGVGDGDYGTPEDNKLYRTGKMRSVGCRAYITGTQGAKFRKFVRQDTKCLGEAWGAQLGKQNIAFEKPATIISYGSATSPCGSSNVGYVPIAFYCGANRTMYFSEKGASQYNVNQYRDYLTDTVAHEYGHHIQELTGILEAYNQRYQEAYGSTAKTTLLSRRTELQAQCFSGVFAGRNASSMRRNYRTARYSQFHSGDNAVEGYKTHPEYRTHGTYANSGYWSMDRGWASGDPGRCNTWTAPKPRVA